ncbi:protein GVQW3-like isoform X1 [Oratosquilla oratoria]|uniref:protein GVQW3-like isoform X1 n=1 Tax=Oratosquilla oratoria TaxID=337810 RepID=UPI003F75BA2D
MTERLEQRYCIKFCQKLGDSQVETIRKIQTAFGDDAMGITQIKKWYNRFKDGRTTVESETRSGRPSTCRNDQVIAKVNAVVMRDRRVTIREIAEEVGISTFSAHSIVTEDLAMKRVAAKFVPKLLKNDEAGVSRAGADGVIGLGDCEPQVYVDVAEDPEDSIRGKHAMSDTEEHSASDRKKLIKIEDDTDVKIDISQEHIHVETNEEGILHNRNEPMDTNFYIKQEPDDSGRVKQAPDDTGRVYIKQEPGDNGRV